MLRRKPIGEDRWNAIMTLEHIVLVERSLLGGLPMPEDMEPKMRPVMDKLKYAITAFSFHLQLMLPVPEVSIMPSGDLDIYEVGDMWEENHRWLRSFITQAPRECLLENYFSHRIAGIMNIEQALSLNLAHIAMHEFHLGQIFMDLEIRVPNLPYQSYDPPARY